MEWPALFKKRTQNTARKCWRCRRCAGSSSRRCSPINPKRSTITKYAHVVSRDPKVILALQAESRKIVRGHGYAVAVRAVMNLVNDPTHRDHARGVSMVLDRVDPAQTHHLVDVQHHVQLDPDAEALAQYRACVAIGASPEKLEQLFGYSGLARLEQRDREERERAAPAAKLIEATVIKEAADVGTG